MKRLLTLTLILILISANGYPAEPARTVNGPSSSTSGNIPTYSDTTGKQLGTGLGVVTTVGETGSDSNVPTEQAVREAVAAGGGGIDVKTADTTITVGSGGDYSTINAALTVASVYYPKYISDGYAVEISLLAGFTMAEQVFVIGRDLSFITITSAETDNSITAFADGGAGYTEVTITGHGYANGDVCYITGTTNYNGAFNISSVAENTFEVDIDYVADDATGTCKRGTNITRSALTAQPDQSNWDTGCYPAFLAMRGAILPNIDVLFNMDSSGTASGRSGVVIYETSRGVILRDRGIMNVPWRGLYVAHGFVYARDTVWDGSGTGGGPRAGAGIRIANGSFANVRDSSSKRCGIGLYVSNSFVQAESINVSDATATGTNAEGDGIRAITSTIDARALVATGCVVKGIAADDGAMVQATDATLTGCGGTTGSAVEAANGATVIVNDADLSGSRRAITAYDGGVVHAVRADLSDTTYRVLSLSAGAYVNVNSADMTGACTTGDDNAVRLYTGSRVDAIDCTISVDARAGGPDILASSGDGCIMNFAGATDGASGNPDFGDMSDGASQYGFLFLNVDTSEYRGDSDHTLTPISPATQIFNVELTVARTITLPSQTCGKPFIIVRNGSATGAYNLYVKTSAGTTIATLTGAGQYRMVIPVSSTWALVIKSNS